MLSLSKGTARTIATHANARHAPPPRLHRLQVQTPKLVPPPRPRPTRPTNAHTAPHRNGGTDPKVRLASRCSPHIQLVAFAKQLWATPTCMPHSGVRSPRSSFNALLLFSPLQKGPQKKHFNLFKLLTAGTMTVLVILAIVELRRRGMLPQCFMTTGPAKDDGDDDECRF